MSLLIKALDKAQAEKAQAKSAKNQANKKVGERLPKALKAQDDDAIEMSAAVQADSELSLSPPETPLLDELTSEFDAIPTSVLGSAAAKAQKEASFREIESPREKIAAEAPVSRPSQQYLLDKETASSTPAQAAKVFTAKRIEATHQNTKLAVIAGAGLIAMLAMGAYYYQFVDSTPDIVIPPRPFTVQPTQTTTPPVNQVQVSEPLQEMGSAEEAPTPIQVFEPRESEKLAQIQKNRPVDIDDEIVADTDGAQDANEFIVSSRKDGKSKSVKLDKAIASDSASIQVSQSKPQDAVNPMVMRAYEAYNAGNDNEAQKLYKQALQRDSSNVDAMLGLGAIATRQGRLADANGWYSKVLEVEPRNPVAQSAILSAQQQSDPQSAEKRIKSMLAKSPSDSDLHTALGNLYAEQNDWSAAQQAYFDAFRLNESAENAFNLGVSLDQMGRPKLALPYYRQALDLAQSHATGIDIGALQARIDSIQ
jgi:tetratricopeptide (TPR) repeat protein